MMHFQRAIWLSALAAATASAQPCFEWQKVTSPSPATGDSFGVAVALDGDTLAVGANQDGASVAVDAGGEVHIYGWNGTAWTFAQTLVAPDTMPGDVFGGHVRLQGDVLVVSARLADSTGVNSGAAYVFNRNAGIWTFSQKLVPPGLDAGDEFGLDISIDGPTLAIGARSDDLSGGRTDAGSVYIYNRVGSTWLLLQQIFAPDGAAGDAFGFGIKLRGTTLVVGSPFDDHPGVIDGGSAYVFTLQGASWIFSRKIVPSDVQAGDLFGAGEERIDLVGDVLFVSAIHDDDQGVDAGAVYQYRRSGADWVLVTKLYANDGVRSLSFGGAVRATSDRMVIGDRLWDGPAESEGAVHLFQRSGTRWAESVRLQASDAEAFNSFGISAGLNDRFVAVGANVADVTSPVRISNTGAVYIYRTVDCLGFPDCNNNLLDDRSDIVGGLVTDFNDNLIPDTCENLCSLTGRGDANNDGRVTFDDITAVLGNFGLTCP